MRIEGAELGQAIPVGNSYGDVWSTTWAEDDALYTVSDDTKGFDEACSSNLAVHRLTGDEPSKLQAETVNCMTEYGEINEILEDAACWKANGMTCIDGVLYLSVSRHWYWQRPVVQPFDIQETADASIVKSEDHGKTWSQTPQIGKAMFPGHAFSTPFFVEYGQDGKGEADGADSYVYAVSSDGAWNNGSAMTMGRVRRDLLGRLDSGDWEFAHGYDEQGQPIWQPRHDIARHVFRSPGRTSMTGIHRIEPLGLYIMPQWHYLYHDDPERRWGWTRFEFYQASAPWGPWTLFHTQDFDESWYNPNIPSKFISEDGKHVWLFVAGDFKGHHRPEHHYYGLHAIPVALDVEQ